MIALDTLAIARDLAGKGFTQQQAEAVAEAVRQVAGMPDISGLASKADLATLRAELTAEIKAASYDNLKWVFIMIMGSVVVNLGGAALLRLLH